MARKKLPPPAPERPGTKAVLIPDRTYFNVMGAQLPRAAVTMPRAPWETQEDTNVATD